MNHRKTARRLNRGDLPCAGGGWEILPKGLEEGEHH